MTIGIVAAIAEQARTELSCRLAARRPEIEDVLLTRIYAISDPTETKDPEYAEGLRAALAAALDYGLIAIELGDNPIPPPPPVLLMQARLAARAGVGLDTVVRRYFAGYALLGDFLIGEAERGGLRGAALQRLLRTQATLFDRLLAAVGEEHSREAEGRMETTEERRAEQVDRLLAGELLDPSAFSYDFGGVHVGLVARGPSLSEAVRELSTRLDLRLLLVRRDVNTVWAWMGGRHGVDLDELGRVSAAALPSQIVLAVGEPANYLAGWRLSHRQAKAAFSVAVRSSQAIVRYRDVALLASTLQDDLLATSLRRMYIAPLGGGHDGGMALRETLRAYFAAERNASSAAAALGVTRQAVAKRLRVAEGKLGRPLGVCETELDAALRLDALEDTGDGIPNNPQPA